MTAHLSMGSRDSCLQMLQSRTKDCSMARNKSYQDIIIINNGVLNALAIPRSTWMDSASYFGEIMLGPETISFVYLHLK